MAYAARLRTALHYNVFDRLQKRKDNNQEWIFFLGICEISYEMYYFFNQQTSKNRAADGTKSKKTSVRSDKIRLDKIR